MLRIESQLSKDDKAFYEQHFESRLALLQSSISVLSEEKRTICEFMTPMSLIHATLGFADFYNAWACDPSIEELSTVQKPTFFPFKMSPWGLTFFLV